MIRVGAVSIDTSHPLAFGKLMLESGRARYTAVYNGGFREDDEVEGFMRQFTLEKKCSTLEELVDSVEIGFIHSCNWDRHLELAIPFFEAGKPVFIDKPIAGNPSDLKLFEEASAKGNVILGSSSARYAEEIEELKRTVSDASEEIIHACGTCGVDEFNYGVHIVEAIGGILGDGAVSTRFCGKAEKAGAKCESYCVLYENGSSALYSNFTGAWQPFQITAVTTKNTHSLRIKSKIYKALLKRIFDYMETGENGLAGIESLTESVRIMLAGKISREKGGEPVALSSIPADYAGFDGAEFEEEYAAAAKKIYIPQ